MTESDLNTDRLRKAAEGKRPWGTPRIILSELASQAQSPAPTSTPFPDAHGGATTSFGS